MLNILMREPAGRNVPYHASEDMIWPKILHIHSGFQSNLYNEHAYVLSRKSCHCCSALEISLFPILAVKNANVQLFVMTMCIF